MQRPSIVLFDVDGTLVASDGAGRRAVLSAFRRLHGRCDAIGQLSLGGMTDRAIMRQGLDAIGEEASDALIDALITVYLEELHEEMAVAGVCWALPGVEQVVDVCLASKDLATGLGTGNVELGARLKLEAAGLGGRFSFGGYGCDGEARDLLLLAGARRGAARLGRKLEECRVVIVGDTPRDVRAARAIGAECIGVATGSFDRDSLLEAGADKVFLELCAPGAIEAILG